MAYASKELKAKVNGLVKEIAKDMGIKLGFSIRIDGYSKLILNIRSCSIDLAKEHKEAVAEIVENPNKYCGREIDRAISYHNSLAYGDIRFSKDRPEEIFKGKALELMERIRDAVKVDFYDDSDAMRDYFACAYYYDIQIGGSEAGFKVV